MFCWRSSDGKHLLLQNLFKSLPVYQDNKNIWCIQKYIHFFLLLACIFHEVIFREVKFMDSLHVVVTVSAVA